MPWRRSATHSPQISAACTCLDLLWRAVCDGAVTWIFWPSWLRRPTSTPIAFGEWLRPELERDAVAAPSEDPDVAIIVAAARSHSVAFKGPPLAQLIDPVPEVDLRSAMIDVLPQVTQGFPGDERNVILTLARIWVGLSSGDIVSKDEAAAKLLKHIDPVYRPTLDLARRAYLGEARDDWDAREQAARAFVEYAEHEIRRLARG